MSPDGVMEVIVYGHRGLVVMSWGGEVLYQDVATSDAPYARGHVLAAQLAAETVFNDTIPMLYVFAAPANIPTLLHYQYQLGGGGKIKVKTNIDHATDERALLLGADLDRDGTTELLGYGPCDPVVQVFNGTGLALVDDNALGQGCSPGRGRLLTDLDNDGRLELLAGIGGDNKLFPKHWHGRILAYRFASVNGALKAPLHCGTSEAPEPPDAPCFSTALPPLYAATVKEIARVGDTIYATVKYFSTDEPPAEGEVTYRWAYSLDGLPLGDPMPLPIPTPTATEPMTPTRTVTGTE